MSRTRGLLLLCKAVAMTTTRQCWTGFGQRERGTVPEQDGTEREREKCRTVFLQTAPGFCRYF